MNNWLLCFSDSAFLLLKDSFKTCILQNNIFCQAKKCFTKQFHMFFKVFNPDVIILYSLENRISQKFHSSPQRKQISHYSTYLMHILAEKHNFCRLAFHDFIFQLFPLFPVRTCGYMQTSCMSVEVTQEVRDEHVISDIMPILLLYPISHSSDRLQRTALVIVICLRRDLHVHSVSVSNLNTYI